MNLETRELLLEALAQALQARVATIWNNVTLAGENDPEKRFIEGVTKAVAYYEAACNGIDKMMPMT